MLGVRLPEKLDQRLTTLARETRRTKSHYVIEALEEFLDVNERTLKVIAKYEKQKRDGTLKTVSMEELMKKWGIDEKDLDASTLD